MKKIILVILIAVMIATPCFAQEVKPEGIFSVDGTAWGVSGIELFISILSYFRIITGNMEFYQGQVYGSSTSSIVSGFGGHYFDLGVVSIAYAYGGLACFLAIMQPTIGLGVESWIVLQPGGCGPGPGVPPICWLPFFGYQIGIMFKINDNWAP